MVDIEEITHKVNEISNRKFEVPSDEDVVKYKSLVIDIINAQRKQDKPLSQNTLVHMKKQYKFNKKNSFIMQIFELLIERHDSCVNEKDDEFLSNAIRIKRGKSHSGVIVLTIMLDPYPEYTDSLTGEKKKQSFSCKYNCSYCPNDPSMPRSYLALEPSCLRGFQHKFDVCEQIWSRINALRRIGHRVITKCEVIVEGGTWASFPVEYRYEYCRDIYYALNVYWDSSIRQRLSLNEEKLINQTTRSRLSGLIIETRPDNVTIEEVKLLRMYGCTRVQLGIQHLDQDVLDKNNRQSSTKDAKYAIKLLKDCGFKIDIHIMPNMYGSSILKDRMMLVDKFLGIKNIRRTFKAKELFEEYELVEPDIQADHWKIYPCQVVPWTELKTLYEQKIYVPYPETELVKLLIETKSHIFNWIRLNRCVRDIPSDYIYSKETCKGNLRNDLSEYMKQDGIYCKCIRCREVKEKKLDDQFILTTRKYRASSGIEYFISAESSDHMTLYGFVRLRIPSIECFWTHRVFPELTKCALIRELHCYGIVQDIGQNNAGNHVQHRGIGRMLLKIAENIASNDHNFNNIAVISGEGVKEYYRKFGFKDGGDGGYMIKTSSD